MAKGFYIGAITEKYTKIEYLQSSSTQYINTGFTPNQNTRVVCEFTRIGRNSSGAAAAVFGSRYAKNNRDFTFWGYLGSSNDGIGGNYGSVNYSLTYPNTEKVLVDKNKNITTINATEQTITNSTSTFTCPGSLFIFATNKNGTADTQMGSIRLYYLKIYDNGTLVRDFVPCININKVLGLFDKVNNKFYANNGSGTFIGGQEINEVVYQKETAKTVKNIYVGVNNISKKIKRAYIGVDGIAKQCWGKVKELTYVGGISGLSAARNNPAATSIGDYALFAGGHQYSNYVGLSTVDVYNKSLTRTTATALSSARGQIGAATIGDYALFAGGYDSSTSTYYSTVDVYNSSLTKTLTTEQLNLGMAELGATSTKYYALFGKDTTAINAYDTSLTRFITTGLRKDKTECKATSIEEYGVFGGGGFAVEVDVYNKSLTHSTIQDLSMGTMYSSALRIGEHILFAGGKLNSTTYATANIDVYDSQLTKQNSISLTSARSNIGAAMVAGYGLFAGGLTGANTTTATTEAFDILLTKVATSNIGARYDITGASIGDYIIFAGGSWRNSSGGAVYQTAYAYTV